MVELTVAQAEEILDKERAYMIAHGGDNQVEAYNMAIRALNNYAKLENIKQIVNAPMGGKHERYNKIVEVLKQE